MFRILRRVRVRMRIDAMDRCRHPRRASRRSTCVPHGGFRDCATRARTSLSGRSRQDASEPAGLDRGASNRLVYPEKAARSRSRREGFARVSTRRFERIVREIVFSGGICGRAKEKPPDGYPRAFACLGDRGDRSPERDQSWCMPLSRRMHALPQSFDSARASASRWNRDVSNGLAVWKAGFIGGLGWNSWCSGSDGTKRCCDGRARYTRIFSIANIFFANRRAVRRMDRR